MDVGSRLWRGNPLTLIHSNKLWVILHALIVTLISAVSVFPQADPQLLEPGKAVERELNEGQTHSYRIALNPGQYVRVAIDQRGIDVTVSLFAPDGAKVGARRPAPRTEASKEWISNPLREKRGH